MKTRIFVSCAFLFAVVLLAVPVFADTLYSNGPTNGNTDAWPINFGFVVSDTFIQSGNVGTINGASFAMWLFPGDTLTSAELSITAGRNLGTRYFDQIVNFTQSACTSNVYGFNVCTESTTFNGPTLNSGTYWINLQNASVASGEPVYWDENSGPARASQSYGTHAWAVGTIPSESFTILGNSTTCMCGCSASPDCTASLESTAPESNSLVLLASGGVIFLFAAAKSRRRLF